jgi:hypothetical protein
MLPRTLYRQDSGVLTRTIGSSGRRRRARRGAGWRHLRRRHRPDLILFFHPCLEGFDAFGKITHHAGQFPGAEKDQDNGQNHNPMHQAE